MSKTVSIISPSYQSYPFICENIESVKRLGAPVYEHIIMDGGSKDETVKYLESLKLPYSFIWISEPDEGQTDAINKAIEKSSGEIVGWLNSDDEYCDWVLQEVMDIFEANPDVDIIHGDVLIIDEKGKSIGLSKGKPVKISKDLLTDNPIKQPGLFFRREVFETLGKLNISLNFVMDREYWLRAIFKGFKFYYLAKPLAKFRLMGGTKTFESNEDFRLEWINVIKENKSKLGLSEQELKNAINENLGSYFYQRALKKPGLNKEYLISMFKAFYRSKKLRTNLGFYKVLGFGMIGIGRNRYAKYK